MKRCNQNRNLWSRRLPPVVHHHLSGLDSEAGDFYQSTKSSTTAMNSSFHPSLTHPITTESSRTSADGLSPSCTGGQWCTGWTGRETEQFPVRLQHLWPPSQTAHGPVGHTVACEVVNHPGDGGRSYPAATHSAAVVGWCLMHWRNPIKWLSHRYNWARCSRWMTALSTPTWDWYAHCRGSSEDFTCGRRWAKTNLSSTFITWDVRTTGR